MNILKTLNDDVLRYILSFLKHGQITIISEVNSYFNKLVIDKKKFFPSKTDIYSSLSMFKWVLEHEYLNKLSDDKRVKKYIEQCIRITDNIDILNYISDNFYINKTNFTGRLYLKALLLNRCKSYEWLKKNKFNYDFFYNYLCLRKEITKDKDLIFKKEEFYDVVKTDNVNEVKWILDSVHHLREYVCLFASETNSEKVFKWAFYKYFDVDHIESIIENIKQNNNNPLYFWLINQHVVYEYLNVMRGYNNY